MARGPVSVQGHSSEERSCLLTKATSPESKQGSSGRECITLMGTTAKMLVKVAGRGQENRETMVSEGLGRESTSSRDPERSTWD